jgi:CheY-like chemotaxis protein
MPAKVAATQLPSSGKDDQAADSKTILVVEDNPEILTLVKLILSHGGSGKLIDSKHSGAPHRLPIYKVLTADSPEKGLTIGLEYPAPIDLLICDFVMPGILGTEVARQIKEARPAMRVMLMSGYPEGELKILADGWRFLRKPFVAAELLQAVAFLLTAAKYGVAAPR